MSKDFYSALKDRRTIYAISPESTISNERIEEIVKYAVVNVPSAFNCQSGRAVILFGDNHKKLWSITMETLRGIVPADSFEPTEQRINGFANGYGTILYFDDTSVTNELMEKFPGYRDNFPVWAQQANGMLQHAIWTSLEIEGLGASLQHYNPLIDAEVKSTWKLPDSWQLIAQMPFGRPTAPAGEKEVVPPEKRVLIF